MRKTTAMLFSLGLGMLIGCGEPSTVALPLGEYLVMGQSGATLAIGAEIKNQLDKDISLVSIKTQVVVGNGISGSPSGCRNYRLEGISDAYQNINPDDTSGVYPLDFPIGPTPLTLAPQQAVVPNGWVDVSPWRELAATGLHTADKQINVAVDAVGYTYRLSGSSEIFYSPLSVKGKTYSLLRAIPASVVAASIVPGGYSVDVFGPLVVTSAYTISSIGGTPEDHIVLKKVRIGWNTTGLALARNKKQLPYTIFASNQQNPNSLAEVVATGVSDVHVDHGEIVATLSLPDSATGIKILDNLTLTIAFDTASTFRLAKDVAAVSITTTLVDGEWSDGTREGLTLSSFTPVNGHTVENLL